ncbi:MAG: DUF1653 domain-containing protein [Lachnospiraceae bacterium]|jgi:hypothetical protein
MGETERIPKPGEIYRHFKNKLYQIVTIAKHTETGEKLVIYQALYGDFKVYARPLSMFTSPVDKNKYPDVVQKMRFEQVTPEEMTAENAEAEEDDGTAAMPHLLLVEFLDAEDLGQQIESLKRMKGKIGQKELDSIYVVLDMIPSQGDPDIQLSCLIKALETRKKYDGSRLR